MNTLNGAPPTSSLPMARFAGEENQSAPKRRKTEAGEEDNDEDEDEEGQEEEVREEDRGYPTLQETFALDVEKMSPPDRRFSNTSAQSGPPRQRAASVASLQSTHRTSNQRPASLHSSNSTQRGVGEYRFAEKWVKGPKPKRPRHKKSNNSALNPQAISDDEDDRNSVPEESTGKTTQHPNAPRLVDSEQYGKQFQKQKQLGKSDQLGALGSKRKASSEIGGLTKQSRNSRNSSPDPLAPGPTSMSQFRTQRTRAAPRGQFKPQASVSASESTRDGITPAFPPRGQPARAAGKAKSGPADNRFAKSSPSRAAIRGGLEVRAAVCPPYSYIHETTDPKCLLRVGDVSTILLPMASDSQDFLQEYRYLLVNLNKVHDIQVEEANHTVRVAHSSSSDLPIAPQLYMEFADPQTLKAFLDWVRMDREEPVSVTVKYSQEDKLFKSLHRLSAQHKQHRIPEPSDADRTPAEPIPEDIPLMSPRRARRRELISMSMKRLTGPKQEARSTQNHDGNSEPITIPESPEASVSRQTRTRRPTIIERSPTPKQWTEENPGWEEKVWRNSLVFPPQGKGRATVDADDIERLDEGEFLNDNLIIFYLRYLQDKLEKEKPRVAERIHFHNTFFYDKLKPSRSSAGINYNGVKSWTSKVDLFTKDFIVVPINEHQHWYVAIIYNPSKLDPSQKPSQTTEKSAALDLTLPEGEEPTKTAAPTMATDSDVEMQDGPKAVETVLRKMSIQSSVVDSDARRPKTVPQHEDEQGKSAKKDVYDVDADTEIQQESPSAASAHRKTKKTGTTARKHDRKHDPNQPKIITLDSLGAPHSPACTHLRQYLIAELKDKKGIEIPDPGALGMTAKKIPEQQNHCDCGLYLLGYVQHFLDDPDAFVHGLLQYDAPTWSFVSSEMRHSIRSLIFELQAKQQSREDAEQEAKRQRKRLAAEEKKTKSRPTSSEGKAMEPVPVSSSAATRAGNPPQSEDGATPHRPISHVSIDGSLILQTEPVTKSIEADGSVLGEDSLIELSRSFQTKTNAEGNKERTSPANRPMPGAFPAPERLGSSETQKGFIQGIKSPESRGATSTDPYEVIDEVGGSLTRQLEEDLHNAKSPHFRSPRIRSPRVRSPAVKSPLVRSPASKPAQRKVKARSDANTARKSVEVEEAHELPKTNIEIPIQSSSPARERDRAKGPKSRVAETGTTSEFFSGATSQPQQEVLTDVQYKGQRKQCKARKEDDAPIIVD